jgi:2-oxoglutarate ferredoxin oxidoreductase subunit beta
MTATDADIIEWEQAYEPTYLRPDGLTDVQMRYCPGCSHGIVHRIIGEIIDEMGIADRTISIASVGCSVYAYEYFNTDAIQASHGRAPAVATGIKRAHPENIIFTYQGDGDLASIGLAEVLHAAARAESITVVFINNAVYGMTQGQMAPTTLMGQKTTTTPQGRSPQDGGYPMDLCGFINCLPEIAYLAREALLDPKHILAAKRSLKLAFEAQIRGLGFSMVELLSTCPTWWAHDPVKSLDHLRDHMIPQFPLQVFRDKVTPAGG